MTGRRGRLDRVQHAMARDRVFEGGAEMRSLAIVAGETRVRLGDVGGRARAFVAAFMLAQLTDDTYVRKTPVISY